MLAKEKKTAEGSVYGAVSGGGVQGGRADRLVLVSGNEKRLGRFEFSFCFFQKLDKFIVRG